jgi:hypothetical protein
VAQTFLSVSLLDFIESNANRGDAEDAEIEREGNGVCFSSPSVSASSASPRFP